MYLERFSEKIFCICDVSCFCLFCSWDIFKNGKKGGFFFVQNYFMIGKYLILRFFHLGYFWEGYFHVGHFLSHPKPYNVQLITLTLQTIQFNQCSATVQFRFANNPFLTAHSRSMRYVSGAGKYHVSPKRDGRLINSHTPQPRMQMENDSICPLSGSRDKEVNSLELS